MLQNYKKATLLGIISFIVPATLGIWFRAKFMEYIGIHAVASSIVFVPCVWLYLRGIKGISLTTEGFYLGLYWVIMYLILGVLIFVLILRIPIKYLMVWHIPLQLAGVILGPTILGKFMGLFRELKELKERSSKQDT